MFPVDLLAWVLEPPAAQIYSLWESLVALPNKGPGEPKLALPNCRFDGFEKGPRENLPIKSRFIPGATLALNADDAQK